MRLRLLFATSALTLACVTAPALGAQPTESDATQLMADGKELYDQGKLEEALGKFQRALELTGSPNARLVVGRCLKDLKRHAEAYAELQRAVRDASELAGSDEKYAKTRDAAASVLALVDPLVGKLIIVVLGADASVTVTLDGKPVPNDQLGVLLPVDPREVVLRLEVPGKLPVERKIAVPAGRPTTVTLTPGESSTTARPTPTGSASASSSGAAAPPPPPPPEEAGPSWFGPVRIAGVVAGVVGMGGAVMYGVLGSMAQSRHTELDDACGGTVCDPPQQERIDQGRLYMILANVGFGVGLAGIGAGIVMLAAGSPAEDESGPAPSLAVGPEGGVAGIRWRF
jgi:hypothetical protein